MGITVAEAAAVINVAIILVQITYPLLIALVAVGVLRRTTNAATWSVFGRLINRSFWPRILRTDVSSGTKVDKRIRIISVASAVVAIVLAVAAAITPLGLYGTTKLQDSSDTLFTYAKDTSPIGLATLSRTAYQANRVCRFAGIFIPCPGNDDGIRFYSNDTGYGVETLDPNARITSRIGSNISDAFTSFTGKARTTIAGPFDIQYRSFINYNNQTEPTNASDRIEWVDGGAKRTQSRFRYYQQFILDNKAQAIEGLVIDTGDTPGIGFRNHTLPPSSALGYSWTEEILWLEPETVCTNLNLTFDYTIPDSFQGPGIYFSSGEVPNARITDRGGFINNARELPDADLNNTQTDAKLLLKSWRAAWITNQILSHYFNETRANQRLGKTYSLTKETAGPSYEPVPNAISFSKFGTAIASINNWSPSLPYPLDGIMRVDSRNLSQPLNESAQVIDVGRAAIGYSGGDMVNISLSGAYGGLMMGVGTQVDGNGSPIEGDERYLVAPGTNWSQPMFSCISAVKASVKMVTFVVNGTNNLSNLIIKDVKPSNYTQDTMPTWAMEYSEGKLARYSPFWGIVSPGQSSVPGIQTIKSDRLYLPAGASSVNTISDLDTIDGVAANTAPWLPFWALEMMYAPFSSSTKTTPYPDYRGTNNWLLFSRWEELSKSAATAGKIRDLIWTDLMANMVVGTKSVLSPSSNSGTALTSANMPAEQYAQGISYDWKYAIPALIFAVVYILLFLWSLFMFVTRNLSINMLRFMLNQTSAGRSMTTERYGNNQQEIDFAKTNTWARVRGDEMVRVGKDTTTATGYQPSVSNGGYYSAINEGKTDGYVQTQSMTPSPHGSGHHNQQTAYQGPAQGQEYAYQYQMGGTNGQVNAPYHQ